MGKCVHGVNAPFVPRVVVVGATYAVDGGVAHVDVGAVHVDFGAQHGSAFWQFGVSHFPET